MNTTRTINLALAPAAQPASSVASFMVKDQLWVESAGQSSCTLIDLRWWQVQASSLPTLITYYTPTLAHHVPSMQGLLLRGSRGQQGGEKLSPGPSTNTPPLTKNALLTTCSHRLSCDEADLKQWQSDSCAIKRVYALISFARWTTVCL